MKKLLVFCALAAVWTATAQPIEKTTFRYAVKGTDTLRMDRYRASGEGLEPSPCLVFVFGGGFVSGTRDRAEYLPFFEYMARQGFTVASIDYRLGLKMAMARGPLDERTFPEAFVSTLAMAVEDLYDATAYIAAQAEAWNIDPAQIVSCGSSAGAITVLMGEYGISNRHPMTGRLPQGFDYAGVISFAGAIFDMQGELRWQQAPAPMLLFHGDADRNVPYGVVRAMGAGAFGSEYIAGSLAEMRVPYMFYAVANADHAVAVSPMDENRYEIDAFLEKLVFQRLPLQIRTEVVPLNLPAVPKEFTIEDYIRANYLP